MRSIRIVLSFTALALAVCSHVEAQEPDVRDIPPFVMLVVDSSGSMEDLPACKCTSDDDCTNCEPKCDLPNDSPSLDPPKDSSGHERKKNRWAVTLEALTGKFNNFQCTNLARTSANGATYDENYPIPYHQPWDCTSLGSACAYPGTTTQQNNGILDSYLETLRFGLITFDGEKTYKGETDLLDIGRFQDTLSTTMPGMWSYGGKQPFKYPGCADTYYQDTGARGPSASEGALISLDSTNCSSPPCDPYQLNATIQEALLKTRPYGGTPIAASLDDLYYHLQNNVTDPFKECRKRYAILITDGEPDKDWRDLRCDCGDEDPMVECPDHSDGKNFSCPYPLAQTVARKLVAGDGTTANPKQIEKLFVLGMSISDTTAVQTLDKIADAGGTTKALQADDPNTLRGTLDSVFSPLLNPISRSVPGFATGLTGTQYQVSTGFQVSAASLTTTTAPPWVGLIERRSFICNQTTGALDAPDLEDKDRFQKVINAQTQTKRDLFTALPAGTVNPADLVGVLARGSSPCGITTYCGKTSLTPTNTAITQAILGVTNATDHRNVIEWMRGDVGSARQGRRLGDIYHSSPTLVGPPVDEPGDDAYTRFRDQAIVKERPLVMYIATNDGILHALSVEDFPVTNFPLTVNNTDPRLPLKAGEEIWGFVPPMLLGKLKDQLSSHQFNFDGTPVVKDVYYQRGTGAADTDYHSVLITGMRGGGHGYIAMDVTDPFAPKFLWQFTDPDMGLTYGQPEIVQATFGFAMPPSTTPVVQTRAVAILSGGVGKKKSSSSTPLNTPGCIAGTTLAMRKAGSVYKSWREDARVVGSANEVDHRYGTPQCWERQGRALYFVDVETGVLIKKVFDSDTDTTNGILLPSPIVGTPTAYQDAVGTIADRGFVMDADGVLWRIDMSSQDVDKDHGDKGWTMRPFHDVFYNKKYTSASETTYERPILTVDDERRVVVLIGTGDTDNFEKPGADNRIVSLTEVSHKDAPVVPDDWQAMINWELVNEGTSGNALYPTELVTGAMALFEGQLFASTFVSNTGSGNACEYGRGRLWSLSYNDRDTSDRNPPGEDGVASETFGPLRIKVTSDVAEDSDDELFNVTLDKAVPNLLIQGVGTTQRAACTVPDPDLKSYFAPTLADITQTAEPAIWVVAQASRGSQRANARLGNVQAKIKRPITFSRVTSWATSVD
jgi:type IV pilus assembly protein PilY1